jgi:phosphate/sulfate permease
MHPFRDARPPRLVQRQLVSITIGAAALLAAAVLFGAALYQRLPLSSSQSLEIGVAPVYCCCAMSESDCVHIEP